MLRGLVTRRHKDHDAEITVADPGVIGTGDLRRCGHDVVERHAGIDADGSERSGQPITVRVGQKQLAAKRPELLGDGGPQHKAGVTH